MSGEAIIRLDADITAYVQKMLKAQQAMGDVAQKTKSAGSEMMRQLDGALPKLLTVAAAVATINRAADVANQVGDKRAGLARQAGGFNLELGRAISMAGGDTNYNRMWASSFNSKNDLVTQTTRDDRKDFMMNIAKLQAERQSKFQPSLSQDQIAELQGMFDRGGAAVFGQGGADIFSSIGMFGPGMDAGAAVQMMLQKRLGRRVTGRGGDWRSLVGDALARTGRGANEQAIRAFEGTGADAEQMAGESFEAYQARLRENQERIGTANNPTANAWARSTAVSTFITRLDDNTAVLRDIHNETKKSNAQPVKSNITVRQ